MWSELRRRSAPNVVITDRKHIRPAVCWSWYTDFLSANVHRHLFFIIETTGHTLAGTLGYLGLYEEEQDIVYDQIMEVVGTERDPVRQL